MNTNGRSPLTNGAGFSGQWFGMPTASPTAPASTSESKAGRFPALKPREVPTETLPREQERERLADGERFPQRRPVRGAQSGGTSADQLYHVWTSCCGVGSLEVEGDSANYLRYPDGSFQLIGQGSIGAEPKARPMALADGGAHLILDSAVSWSRRSPSGTRAIYDRGADGALRVVSLLPEDLTPAAASTPATWAPRPTSALSPSSLATSPAARSTCG